MVRLRAAELEAAFDLSGPARSEVGLHVSCSAFTWFLMGDGAVCTHRVILDVLMRSLEHIFATLREVWQPRQPVPQPGESAAPMEDEGTARQPMASQRTHLVATGVPADAGGWIEDEREAQTELVVTAQGPPGLRSGEVVGITFDDVDSILKLSTFWWTTTPTRGSASLSLRRAQERCCWHLRR